MKNIVVMYRGDDWHKKVPFSSDSTRKSFEDWHNRGQEVGIDFYRASLQWYNYENNFFLKSWAFRKGKWRKITKKIHPDMILDKIPGKFDYELFDLKKQIASNTILFNDPNFRTIFDNKLSQYLIFKNFMAKTFIVQNKMALPEELNKIKTSKIVVKPLYGSGGFGIIICEKDKLRVKDITFPVIIQEFIATNGIPGFSKKNEVSDLRIVFMNHQISYALSRIAKRGSLFTNFHQGATAVLVPESKIPSKASQMTKKILEILKVFPLANYSLDYIFDKKGNPFLVEINTTPGFDLLNVVGNEKIKAKYFKDFIKNLN